MFVITLCVLIVVTVSDCDLEVSQSSGRWEGLFERPFGLREYLDLSKGSLDIHSVDKPKNYIEYWDWRNQRVVSPVKNELNCAACWAFAIVAAIESHTSIYLNEYEILSEQFLIDCVFAGEKNTSACSSGRILETYYEIIMKYGGVLRESDYRKYSAEQKTCEYPSINPPRPVPLYGFRRVNAFNEEIMKNHIYTDGPLVARINVASMNKYRGGIDDPTEEECDPALESMNHAVLIVGFSAYVSEDIIVPYWIIKNSWGTTWGDQGYYYLVRGKNACGITNDVSLPIVSP